MIVKYLMITELIFNLIFLEEEINNDKKKSDKKEENIVLPYNDPVQAN